MTAFRAVKSLVVGFRPARLVVESRFGASSGLSGGGGSSPVSVRRGSSGVSIGANGGPVYGVFLSVCAVIRPARSRMV